MEKIQIGTFARRTEDGSFLPSQPICQDVERAAEGIVPVPPYDDLAKMFYKIIKNAKAIKRRKES